MSNHEVHLFNALYDKYKPATHTTRDFHIQLYFHNKPTIIKYELGMWEVVTFDKIYLKKECRENHLNYLAFVNGVEYAKTHSLISTEQMEWAIFDYDLDLDYWADHYCGDIYWMTHIACSWGVDFWNS